MRFEFHPEALAEYDDAGHYYRWQQPGLESRFVGCVEETIERILDDPDRARPFDEDVRRSFTKVFPYAVIYTIESDFVLIIAVAHCSREPGYWKHRRSDAD